MLLRSGRRLPRFRAPVKKKTPIKKLKKDVSKLNKAMKAELRFHSTATVATDFTQAIAPVLLNGMEAGDIDGKRDSSMIQMKSVDIRMRVYVDEAKVVATDEAILFRCTLVYDRRPDKALLLTQDLFQTGGTASRNVYAPPLFTYRKRFKILYDRQFTIKPYANTRGAVGTATADNPSIHIKVRKRLNLPVEYIAGAGAGDISDITKGSLYWIVHSETDAEYWNFDVLSSLQYNP